MSDSESLIVGAEQCNCLLVKSEPLPDEMLWVLVVASGGRDHFEEIVKRYKSFIASIAKRFFRRAECHADVDDIIQMVFLDIFQYRHTFTPWKGSFKGWLAGCTFHRCSEYLKYLGRAGETGVTVVEKSTERDPAVIRRIWVEQMLENLSPQQRRVVKLICIEEFTAAEVSLQTNKTFDAIRNHYHRGIKKLREVLESPPEIVNAGFCVHGHPLVGNNLFINRAASARGHGNIFCRLCAAWRKHKYMQKQYAAKVARGKRFSSAGA